MRLGPAFGGLSGPAFLLQPVVQPFSCKERRLTEPRESRALSHVKSVLGDVLVYALDQVNLIFVGKCATCILFLLRF